MLDDMNHLYIPISIIIVQCFVIIRHSFGYDFKNKPKAEVILHFPHLY